MNEVEPLFFELSGGGRVLFTTRAEGNMSSVGGDDAEHGQQAREHLRARIAVDRLVRGYQVHGTVVRRMVKRAEDETGASDAQEADGQATALRGVGTMVLTADCLPVVLGSERAVAALHAGWRGLAAGVLEEGIRALRELGGALALAEDTGEGDADGEIVAVIGPGAGVCCYEVGEEVHAAFGGVHRDDRRIDIKAIARDRLEAAGVAEVRDVGACTICDERFFSYRREGARAGRQAGVAWLS
jgi:YfiH family protein